MKAVDETARHNGRLDFLDAIRGIAATSVAIEHIGERLFPGFVYFVTTYFQLGQFGVTVFFLTSGFIIPNSIERIGSLRQFWMRRLLRLYPLFLFSMVVAFALLSVGLYKMMPASLYDRPFITITANLVMLQEFLGQGNILPLYWTLNFEMVFYLMVSALFVAGLLRRTVMVAALWLVLAMVAGYILPRVLAIHSGNGLFFNFATMFVGTVIYRLYKGQVNSRKAGAVLLLAAVSIVVINYSYFFGQSQPAFLGTRSFLPMITAWFGAYLVFVIGFHYRRRAINRPTLYLGRISYSVYLMQALVISAVPVTPFPVVTAVVWMLALIGISSLTYTFIERPFIALGRRSKRGFARGGVAGGTSA